MPRRLKAASLVQTVFLRKGNYPSNLDGYRLSCSVFMKYPARACPMSAASVLGFGAVA